VGVPSSLLLYPSILRFGRHWYVGFIHATIERQDLIENSLIEAIIIAIIEIIVRTAETSVVLYREVMLVDIVQVEGGGQRVVGYREEVCAADSGAGISANVQPFLRALDQDGYRHSLTRIWQDAMVRKRIQSGTRRSYVVWPWRRPVCDRLWRKRHKDKELLRNILRATPYMKNMYNIYLSNDEREGFMIFKK
jgi:hypothetical protein